MTDLTEEEIERLRNIENGLFTLADEVTIRDYGVPKLSSDMRTGEHYARPIRRAESIRDLAMKVREFRQSLMREGPTPEGDRSDADGGERG